MAEPLWVGDFETSNLTQWGTTYFPTGRPITVVTVPRFSGSYAAKFELRNGDLVGSEARSEVGMTQVARQFVQGDDLYFGWATYFDADFPLENKWWNAVQWKHDGAGEPWVALGNDGVNPAKLQLRRNVSGNTATYWEADLLRGHWHRFVVRIKFHSSAATGLIELWHAVGDDELVQQTLLNGSQTWLTQTLPASGSISRLRQGYHRDPTHVNTGIVYGDSMQAGLTHGSVVLYPEVLPTLDWDSFHGVIENPYVDIKEEFDNDYGEFSNYDAYDVNAREAVRKLKHINIRSFRLDDIYIEKPLLFLNTQKVAELESLTMAALDADTIIKPGEQWSAGTVEKATDRNSWSQLSLACALGIETISSSAIQPPAVQALGSPTQVEALDLLTGFEDDDFISVALPAFPLGAINTAASFIEFTSSPTGSFADAHNVVSVALNQSTIALVAGDSELRFPRSLLDNALNLKYVTGVRFRILATAAATFRAMAIRLLSSDWRYGKVDMNTRYEYLEPTVAPNGSISRPYDFVFPNLFRATTPSGKYDPKPIDTKMAIAFNTGDMRATTASQNSFTIYLRERPENLVQQMDINGAPQSTLDGESQPTFGASPFDFRPQSELNVLDQGSLTGQEQEALEQTVDTTLGAWTYVKLRFFDNGGFIDIKNSDNIGYTFSIPVQIPDTDGVLFTDILDAPPLFANGDYALLIELEEHTLRVQLYSLDINKNLDTLMYDTYNIVDDTVIPRTKGRVGWSTNFVDGDVKIYGIRTNGLNYGEYRSSGFVSFTPVDGAEISVDATGDKELFANWTTGPFGGTLTEDFTKSATGKSLRVDILPDDSVQGIQTNLLDITNFSETRIKFDVYHPSNAPELEAFLIGENGHITNVDIGAIAKDRWSTINIYPSNLTHIFPGRYALALLVAQPVSTKFWVDKTSMIERSIKWSARAVQNDPWDSQPATWTMFDEVTNLNNGGVLFPERGNKLQMRGQALKQNVRIGKIKIKPKYAELGRFAWTDEATTSGSTPIANFSLVQNGLAATFYGNESTDLNPIINWEWTYGEGSRGFGRIVTFNFPQSGTYNVILTVINQYGVRRSFSRVVTP